MVYCSLSEPYLSGYERDFSNLYEEFTGELESGVEFGIINTKSLHHPMNLFCSLVFAPGFISFPLTRLAPLALQYN